MENLVCFFQKVILFWQTGTWFVISGTALMILLIWFLMGVNFKKQNRELWFLIFCILLFILPFSYTLPITPERVVKAIKIIFHYHSYDNISNKSSSGEEDDFNLMNAVVGVVALFLTLLPFLIERIIRENRDEIKGVIQDVHNREELVKTDMQELTKQMQELDLQVMNAKCYTYYNRIMNDSTDQFSIVSAQRLLNLFEYRFDQEKAIEDALSGFVGLTADKFNRDLKLLHKLPETEDYLQELSKYYKTRNSEIAKRSHALATGRQPS